MWFTANSFQATVTFIYEVPVPGLLSNNLYAKYEESTKVKIHVVIIQAFLTQFPFPRFWIGDQL